MSRPTVRRRRGVILTALGLKRCLTALREREEAGNEGSRLSLERIGTELGLAPKTVSRVLSRETPVDLRMIDVLFTWLGLTAAPEDYAAAHSSERDGVGRIPLQHTTFFGRDELLERVLRTLQRRRLVTLTGAGGIGKSRLALELGSRLAREVFDRVIFVDLSVVSEPIAVRSEILAAFGARDAKRPIAAIVAGVVGRESRLAILDGCEHVRQAVACIIEELSKDTTAVSFLSTSREPLGVVGEAVIRVPPLDPDTGFALFVDRARLTDDTLDVDDSAAPVVADIVRRVEGFPLDIELLAGRVYAMSLVELRDSLGRRMEILAAERDPVPARHRSARLSVDWSYNLLDDAERAAFRRLAPFMGSFDTRAATATVCALDIAESDVSGLLTNLVRKSLIIADRSADSTRFRLLETVRQFAQEKLEIAGEEMLVRLAHARYFLGVVTSAEPDFGTERREPALAQMEREEYNISEALSWSINSSEHQHIGAAIAAELGEYWEARCELLLGEMWLRRALEYDSPLVSLASRARLLEGLALLLYRQARLSESAACANRAWESFVALKDARGITRARNLLGVIALDSSEVERARGLFATNLQEGRAIGYARAVAVALNNLGRITIERDGREQAASELFEESLHISRGSGLLTMVAITLANLAELAFKAGRLEDAQAYVDDALKAARRLGGQERIAEFAALAAVIRMRRDGVRAAHEHLAELADAVESAPFQLGSSHQFFDSIAAELIDTGEVALAATLLGAGKRDGSTPERHASSPTDGRVFEVATQAREALGARDFERILRHSGTLSVSEALRDIIQQT